MDRVIDLRSYFVRLLNKYFEFEHGFKSLHKIQAILKIY